MRMLYLALGIFILLNIGAACRTPQALPKDCEAVAGGLIHCAREQARQHE